MVPLFGLCEKLFCNVEKGFAVTPDFSNTYEIEYYNSDGINYASISVAPFNEGLSPLHEGGHHALAFSYNLQIQGLRIYVCPEMSYCVGDNNGSSDLSI